MSAPALKNIKKNVEAAHTAKLKEEQAAKAKKGKGKGASVKMGTDKVRVNVQNGIRVILQCVHGSTDIVRHTVTPLYNDISKI